MTSKSLLAGLLSVVWLTACAGDRESPHPMVLVGIDGGDWGVIESLWARGSLPELKALADRGATATLRTAYGSKSPVVWTTVATGVTAQKHGITDFVVRTPAGDVPVSSSVRRAPALWNMISAAERRVLVLGWWASWPAEEVNGIVVSDRAPRDVEQGIFPPDWRPDFERLATEAREDTIDFPSESVRAIDQLVAYAAWKLAAGDFDLLMAYLRSVDEVSHRYWKHYRPEGFPEVDPQELAAHQHRIPSTYAAVDAAIGRIVESAGPANILVISDHGFYGLGRERWRVSLDFDRVLAHLGFLSYNSEGGVDMAKTLAFTHVTPPGRSRKKLRFALAGRERGGTVSPAAQNEIRRDLEARLSRVRYASGSQVFRVLEPNRLEREEGADVVVKVLAEGATRTISYENRAIGNAVANLSSISGSHGGGSHGILIAAGPDIDPGADLDGITIHDVAPTVLFGLGLPVAEDFDGRPYVQLFKIGFRERYPLRTITSWGAKAAEGPATSAADEDLIEELRALGYLD